jgi:hypothetical protein
MTIASAISMIPRFLPSFRSPDILIKGKINHAVNGGFTLAYTYSFNDNSVKTSCFTKRYGFSSFRATPPNVSPEAEGRINAFYPLRVLPFWFIPRILP